MPFSSLPLELVRITLEHCADDIGSLFNLSLVNRHLNREAELILYRTVNWCEEDNLLLISFLTTVLNSRQRANRLRSLDLLVYSDRYNEVSSLISLALPCFPNLQKLFLYSLQPHGLGTWPLRNLPFSLVSLNIGLDCGPTLWGLLRSAPNVRHLIAMYDEEPHNVCNFPSDIVPRLSSFFGCLPCAAKVLPNRPVTALSIGGDVDIDFLHDYMGDITHPNAEITSLHLLSVPGFGDRFLVVIATQFPSLMELEIKSSSEDIQDRPETWGLIFRRFKSLRRIEIAMSSTAISHEDAGSVIISWTAECPLLSDVVLCLNDHGPTSRKEHIYHRNQLDQPGVLTTKQYD